MVLKYIGRHMPNPFEKDWTKLEEHDVYTGKKSAEIKPNILSDLAKAFKDYELSQIGGHYHPECFTPGNYGWNIPGYVIQGRNYPENLPEPDHVVEEEE